MIKNKAAIAGIIAAASVALVLGLFLLPRLSEDRPPSEPPQETDTAVNLGITYIRVTPTLSAYYDLGVDSGVLVTEVISGSPMDYASVQVGDIILSCNGTKLDEGVSLIYLMRETSTDEEIAFEICRGDCCYSVSCCAGCGTSLCICSNSKSGQ